MNGAALPGRIHEIPNVKLDFASGKNPHIGREKFGY